MAGRMRGLLERILARRREIAGDSVPDAELLRRFTRERDEAAFELLVWRHGAMVLGVCRRALRDEQLAEDAFQAVFLVLARKADAVRGNLGGWLFRIARRVALRALKQQPNVQPVVETPAAPLPCPAERDELSALLDAEIERLPERLRRPVVLCYLAERTTEDAARELGCPRGTVLSRLATARKRLADRLTRRGVTLPATLTGATLSNRLVSDATAAAPAFRTGALVLSTAPQLADGVIRTMARATLLTATGGLMLVAAMAGGIGWVAASGEPGTGNNSTLAPAPMAAAAEPGAQPPDKATPPTTKANTSAKLQKQSEELAARLSELQRRIDTEAQAAVPAVGLETLQAQLLNVETDIFNAENRVKSRQAELDMFIKYQEEAAQGNVRAGLVDDRLRRLPTVQEADQQLQKTREALATLRKTLAADHALVKAAEKAIADETEKCEAVRKAAFKEAEKVALADWKKSIEEALKNAKLGIKQSRETLENQHEGRRKLLERIADLKQRNAKWEQLQEEMKMLRQIQLELFRLKTLAELGIDAIVPMRDSSRTDAEIKDLRREIAEMRAEVEKLRGQKK